MRTINHAVEAVPIRATLPAFANLHRDRGGVGLKLEQHAARPLERRRGVCSGGSATDHRLVYYRQVVQVVRRTCGQGEEDRIITPLSAGSRGEHRSNWTCLHCI